MFNDEEEIELVRIPAFVLREARFTFDRDLCGCWVRKAVADVWWQAARHVSTMRAEDLAALHDLLAQADGGGHGGRAAGVAAYWIYSDRG